MKLFKTRKSDSQGLWDTIRYGIREVLLVVIGILIAVGINNWNENRKEEKELDGILTTIKMELKDDIIQIDSILSGYEKRKPFYEKYLAGEVGKNEFGSAKTYPYLIFGYPELSLDRKGLNLLHNLNYLPKGKKGHLTTKIQAFYSERLKEIEADEKIREDDFDDNFKFWKNNFDWWADYITFSDFKGFTDYAYQGPDFKNRVASSYTISYTIYLPELTKFKNQGQEIIDEIESLID